MNVRMIRVCTVCICMLLCASMVACDGMIKDGIVGELLEQIAGTSDKEKLPEDVSEMIGSVIEGIPETEKGSDNIIPTPDTEPEYSTEYEYPTEDVTVDEPIYTPDQFVEGLEYRSHGDGTCTVVGIGTCTDSQIVIPSQLSNGDVVVGIGLSAFSNCENITEVVIPDSVTQIEYYAFFSCDNLTSVSIPESVTELSGTFVGCISLKSIYLHKDIKLVTGETFSGCANLEEIVIAPENEKYHSIDNCIVETATNTLTVAGKNSRIPDYITSIGERAFEGRADLKVVHVPDGVTSIGALAFSGCSNLQTIEIPDSVTYMGEHMFVGDTALESITVPAGVESIGGWSFFCCTSLKEITILNPKITIGEIAFAGCPGLTDVYFAGTQQDWDALVVGEQNEALLEAEIHLNYVPES